MKIKTFKNGLIRIHGKIGSIEMNQNYIGLTMNEYEESWHRNYGFWVSKAETDMALPF